MGSVSPATPPGQAMTVLMSLAVPADDPPATVQPDRSPPSRRAPLLGAWVRCGWVRCGTATGWPVAVILVLQAAASLRLAGGLGGPVAARLLSLLLMLGATLALHGVTRRLMDRRSAFFAAALFAGLGGTAVLGSLASGGAISLSLVALAAWLGIRAAEAARGSGRVQGALAVASGAALALACATDHRCVPAALIAALVNALASWRSCGRAAAWRAAALTCAAPGLLLAAGWLEAGGLGGGQPGGTQPGTGQPGGGQPYLAHVLAALPSKAASSPAVLVAVAGPWLGAVAILAAIGALAQLAARPAWPVTAMSVALAVAVAAVPLTVAGDLSAAGVLWPGTCGAWFACIMAGYAVTSLARGVPRHKSAAAFGAGLGLVALAAGPGLSRGAQQLGARPAGPIVATMATALARQGGPVLSNDGGLLQDYLGPEVAGRVMVGPARCRVPGPAAGGRGTGLAACQEAIRRHYFGVILLSLGPAARADRLERTIVLAGYQRVAARPGGLAGRSWNVWVRAGRP